MALLAVPPVLDGAGDLVPARLFVRLMLANGTSAIGFVGTDLVTEFQNLAIPLAGLELELTPQASIALDSGEATYYEVRIQAAHRTERFLVQLADLVPAQDLRDLVGAAAIDPDSILAGQLLTVDERAALDASPTPPTGLNPIATISDVEAGVAGVASFETRIGAVVSAAGDYTAAEIGVVATPVGYTAATADVEAHLGGIDSALTGLLVGADSIEVVDALPLIEVPGVLYLSKSLP